MDPRVTVLTAVYNGQAYLAEAIDSILCQTYQDFEFLIIDDGSTDASADITARYAALDSRIRVYRQDNGGLARALNLGIQMSRGAYIARMDADDISLPQRLQRQVRALQQDASVALVAGGVAWIDSGGTEIGRYLPSMSPADIRRALLENNMIIHPTVIFRKAAVVAAGGYRPAFRYAQDYDLWLRLAEQANLTCIGEVVLKYRLHDSQLSVASVEAQALAAVAARHAAACRATTGADPLRGVMEITYDVLQKAGLPRCLAAQHVLDVVEQNGLNFAARGDVATARRIAASIPCMHAGNVQPRRARGAEQAILFAVHWTRCAYLACIPSLCRGFYYQPLRLVNRLGRAAARRLDQEWRSAIG